MTEPTAAPLPLVQELNKIADAIESSFGTIEVHPYEAGVLREAAAALAQLPEKACDLKTAPRMVQTPAGLAEPWQVGEETDDEHAAALAQRNDRIPRALLERCADHLTEAGHECVLLDELRAYLDAAPTGIPRDEDARIAALRAVIEWALGEGAAFPDWPVSMTITGNPKFWWRKELRKRYDAAMQEGQSNG
jgi:hypothetical protein